MIYSIRFYLVLSCPFPSHPIPSHPIPSHPILFHIILSHLTPSHLVQFAVSFQVYLWSLSPIRMLVLSFEEISLFELVSCNFAIFLGGAAALDLV